MYETRIEPRVSETDGAGHINNTVVPIWFEAGRKEIFKLFTPDLSFKNWRMVIVNINVDYIRQLYYGREVTVKTWVKKIGNSSLVLYEEIWQDGDVCAKAQTTYVNFNFEIQKTEPIPSHIRQELEKHLLEEQE
ncbi:acyl-CoA thioester hydrolase [Caldalkalibacillus uzonensis]|uniref:Acyl-CoA thioester hydrolase n=1 Tax=Caldalkalibacillus uzonensis TaxID=353224 RepID=A0ABU0CVR9_9BACI|nr:thioesterase family protein [Caldalkalibacillus uzonensis]MDQ0339949.1 acyl-CoA thioester hydrolase [Caldalkalibacillus uzonensis]